MSRRRRVAVAVVAVIAVAGCGSTEEPDDRSSAGAATTTTGPPRTAPSAPSGFAVFGDFGGGPAQPQVADAIKRWIDDGHHVDALVTTGDNVYDFGEPEMFRAHLDEPYAELRREGRSMWVTLGNHDVARGFGGEQLRHLGLPELPYRRTLPGVQLLFMDGNRPGPQQAEWLDARLSEPGPRFRIVVFHQPAYSCSKHGSTTAIVEHWVPVIERHRVSLVFSGHDHLYERFTSARGVTYVVSGGGGRELYAFRPPCDLDVALESHAETHHFVGVEIDGDEMHLTAVESTGRVIDRAVIDSSTDDPATR